MRKTLIAAILAGLTTSAAAEEATGVWKTAVKEDGRYLHVEIMPCADAPEQLCGKIAGAFGGANEANIGKPIIWGMTADGDNEWSDGTIWAPDEDKTYDSEMELNAGVLEVSGCVLAGLICRGQNWTRP